MGRANTLRERAAMGGVAWFEDLGEVLRLFRWLQASDEHALPLEEVEHFLEKPWKWSPEREEMLSAEASK